MKSNFLNALQNWHISGPLALGVTLEILPVIFPQIKTQCAEIQKIFLAYGIIAAANSGPQPPKQP